jgi:hypothetical protein
MVKKHKSLEEKGHFVCDKCFYQFAHGQPGEAETLTKQIESVKLLYDKKLIGEEQYHDLLKLLISVYIGTKVTTTVTSKFESIFREQLSPERLLAFT